MHFKYAALLSLSILAGHCVLAQSGRLLAKPRDQGGPILSGPSLGCLLRTSPVELRQIWGVPGATYVSSAQAADVATNAVMSSAHDWLLIDRGNVSVLTLSGCVATRTTDLGISGGIDIGASSPSGTTAAVYSRAANAVTVITGFPDNPTASTVFRDTDLPGSITSIAASDSSTVVVSTSSGVYLLQSGSSPTQLFSSTDVPSMAFMNGSTDLAIADRADGQIVILHNVAGTVSPEIVATAGDDASRPVMLVTTGRGLIVGLAGGQLICTDTTKNSTTRVSIMANADRIATLLLPGVVMVTAPGQPAQLVNFNESNPSPYLMAMPERQQQ